MPLGAPYSLPACNHAREMSQQNKDVSKAVNNRAQVSSQPVHVNHSSSIPANPTHKPDPVMKNKVSPPVRSALPIDEHRDEILYRIGRDRVTIIQGETGCGKSSRLPVMLLEDATSRGIPCRIMVSISTYQTWVSPPKDIISMLICSLRSPRSFLFPSPCHNRYPNLGA